MTHGDLFHFTRTTTTTPYAIRWTHTTTTQRLRHPTEREREREHTIHPYSHLSRRHMFYTLTVTRIRIAPYNFPIRFPNLL